MTYNVDWPGPAVFIPHISNEIVEFCGNFRQSQTLHSRMIKVAVWNSRCLKTHNQSLPDIWGAVPPVHENNRVLISTHGSTIQRRQRKWYAIWWRIHKKHLQCIEWPWFVSGNALVYFPDDFWVPTTFKKNILSKKFP
jgi:hypothetical protein